MYYPGKTKRGMPTGHTSEYHVARGALECKSDTQLQLMEVLVIGEIYVLQVSVLVFAHDFDVLVE